MKDDLTFDTHYGYWFNLACERFYKRIDFCVNFVQLVGGSGAALAAINGSQSWVIGSGVALAVCAATSLLMQPGVKAEQHLQAKGRYLAIKGRLHDLTAEQLSLELTEAQRSGPTGIQALALPAWNSTMMATGREDGIKSLSWSEHIAHFVG